jgi:hypothetical protein
MVSKPVHQTASSTHKARCTFPSRKATTMRPPTAAEEHAAEEAWQERWAKEQAEREKREVCSALQRERLADKCLAAIDEGRGVVKMLPGMAPEQVTALYEAVLVSGNAGVSPNMVWIEKVRWRRSGQRCPPMTTEFLVDHVQLHRRLAFIQDLEAKETAKKAREAAERKASPLLPAKKLTVAKPTITKKPVTKPTIIKR